LRAECGEGEGEVVEGFGECGARVADEKGDELHRSTRPLVFREDRNKGEVFLSLFLDLNVAAEVSA
jgi:hypothetical protein